MQSKVDSESLVMRGGAWFNGFTWFVRSAKRNPSIYGLSRHGFGFRCCKPVFNLKQIKRWQDETEGGLFDR